MGPENTAGALHRTVPNNSHILEPYMVARSQTALESESRLVSAAAFSFGLLYSLVSLPPWIPAFLTSEEFRDPSWRYVLNQSFVDRLRYGTEVIFTYGPYGFLTTRIRAIACSDVLKSSQNAFELV